MPPNAEVASVKTVKDDTILVRPSLKPPRPPKASPPAAAKPRPLTAPPDWNF